MTDLTEQWKKGELPEGWYWVDCYSVDGVCMLEYIPQHNGFGYEEKNLIQRVLAPVPSYEEWKASEKYNKHLEEVIKIYERKDKQATETSIAYNELVEENAKLKELLKEIIADADLSYCDSDIELRIDEALK
jgi:hypothetical protein